MCARMRTCIPAFKWESGTGSIITKRQGMEVKN